jgi:hypothetical protein
VQLGDVSFSLKPNFVVVQFKSCITLFKFIKKCVMINSKVFIKEMHDHLGEQVNIMIDGKDMQKKIQMGQKIGGNSHGYMYINMNLFSSR